MRASSCEFGDPLDAEVWPRDHLAPVGVDVTGEPSAVDVDDRPHSGLELDLVGEPDDERLDRCLGTEAVVVR